MFSPLVWLIIGLAFMGLEVLVPGFFLFWFGAGALLTAGLSALELLDGAEWQWFVFLVSSFASLLLWQFWLKKYFRRKVVEDERDATVSGRIGVLTKAIEPDLPGEVEFNAHLYGVKRWTAEADESIPAGAKVRVIEARGIRLYVQRVE